MQNVVLAVHGGIAPPQRELTAEIMAALRADLASALQAGAAALHSPSGTALDGVEAAVRFLEDSPLFNAGKGAIFTREGRIALDAAIMEGETKRAGSVAGVTTIKNPITAARAVMERSPHVMLIGGGAEDFAREEQLEIVSPEYFKTDRRWEQHLLQREKAAAREEKKDWGTVGAVALDRQKNLAAATSTGGMSNQRAGRVGDTPIIGAGTYADNGACAISCTGHGEYFIRLGVAHEIIARMKYSHLSIQAAADQVVLHDLTPVGGEGGIIGLDRQGNCAFAFNTTGLFRGYITEQGDMQVMLFAD